MAESQPMPMNKITDALLLVASSGWMPNERNWDAEQIILEIGGKIAELCSEGVATEGASHKQYYLEQIAKALGIELPEHERGIAP